MIEIIELINFNCYFFTKTWEHCSLGNLVNSVKSYSLTRSEEISENKGYKYIHYGDIHTGVAQLIDNINKLPNIKPGNYISLNKGDVVIADASEDYKGIAEPSILLSDSDQIVVSGLHTIAMRPQKIDSLFLYYNFKRDRFRKFGKEVGTGLKVFGITRGNLYKYPMYISKNNEQNNIGKIILLIEKSIALQQRQLDLYIKLKKGLLQKLFPKNEEKVPEVRFADFTGNWELRKLSTLFNRVNERNNGQFNNTKWISVSQMYFQSSEKVQSNNIDTRTYVMRKGDIAFEGHPNKEYKFGRFVANDIGDGVVSELFPVYRPIENLDLNYLKFFIHQERIMEPIFAKSITSSGNSSNKLNTKHFLKQSVRLATLDEQHKIGSILKIIENAENLQQEKVKELKLLKEYLLQKLFI